MYYFRFIAINIGSSRYKLVLCHHCQFGIGCDRLWNLDYLVATEVKLRQIG
ncbi:hypothetical protein [Nostoc sp.]|uniref:hypothetical protein n=1 Tax=Nostoc sp. TaxID=1180 RepID=UPI002FF0A397